MTPREFLDLSTRLCKDMKDWSVQASADNVLSPSDLVILKSVMGIVERATTKDVQDK
jgi:hypothetical protein